MAKVAKKSASSSKKSVASAKPVAKKADKQKKTAVKGTPTASKKKVAAKVVAKKSAPAKAAAKKVVAKKSSKPAAPAKKASVKAAKVVATKAKVAAKKPIAKAEVKSTAKNAPSSKKAIVPAKGKVAPVKTVKPAAVAKAVPAKPEKAVPQKAKPVEVKKASAAVPATAATPMAVAKTAASATGKPRRKKKKNDDDDDDEEEVVFRKPAKKVASAVKKSSAKYISEELTMEGPAPRRIGQITMTSEEKIKLKKALLNRCIDIQKNTVAIAKKAMDDALTSANAEKVSEELSDSFRESMHATRDMYARQANEGVNNLGLLNRINIVEHDKVKFGSVVFTNFQNYFISTGLGEIKVDDLSFQAVSTLAPLFQILVDKKKGDTFMFLDRLYTVIEVF